MKQYIKHLIMDNWSRWFPKQPYPQQLRFLMVSRTHRLLFIFIDNASYPQLVAKIPRKEREIALLKREYAQLNKIRSMLSPAINVTILEPLHIEAFGHDFTGLEKVLPGYPKVIKSDPTGRKIDMWSQQQKEAALTWLTSFHQQTTTSRITLGKNDTLSNLLTPLENLKKYYPLSPQEKLLRDHLSAIASELSGYHLPLVCQHGDFWSGNILWQKDKIGGVVDWEYSAINTLPFNDLFLFAQDVCSTPLNGATLKQIPFIKTYCNNMAINIKFIALFWPLFLATMANRECEARNGKPTTLDCHFYTMFKQYANDKNWVY